MQKLYTFSIYQEIENLNKWSLLRINYSSIFGKLSMRTEVFINELTLA